jgi:RNA polymerase sigma-70 factor (ECF subfamily)
VPESDDAFVRERPRLVGLAYRLLGSLTDAEDVVQEAWVRWNRVDHGTVHNPTAWLTTVVSRIGIDRLRVRQRDQADYVGPWLPEPIVTFEDEPAAAAELSDSLTTAFLVLLERLAPDERLVLLLADVFQQPFATVADVIGKSEDATRQIAVRARRKVRTDEEARRSTRAELLAAANEFVAAVVSADESRVRELLASDVVLTSDGGPRRHAARRAVVGSERVARFVVNVTKRFMSIRGRDVTVKSGWVNGSPGIVIHLDGHPYWIAAFDIVDGHVVRCYAVNNPDKLLGAQGHVDLV